MLLNTQGLLKIHNELRVLLEVIWSFSSRLIQFSLLFLQLHECIGSAIGAMGPKEFLNVLHVQNISDANVWILPLLKQYTVGASLSFFVKEILKMISCIQENIPKVWIIS